MAMENSGSENICKIIVLESNQQRIFHPKLHDNFLDRVRFHKKSSSIKKCLFGKSNPDDTKRMLDEQYIFDKERLFTKFGFDIETIENLERIKNHPQENIENDRNGQNRDLKTVGCNIFSGPVKHLGRKVLKARRKVNFNKTQASHSQQFITDFYHARKNSVQPLEKKQIQAQQNANHNTGSTNC